MGAGGRNAVHERKPRIALARRLAIITRQASGWHRVQTWHSERHRKGEEAKAAEPAGVH